MIPKPIENLLVKIAGSVKEEKERWVKEDPEKGLVALLLNIRERMEKDRSYAMLDSTVERAFYEDKMAQAGKLLKRSKSRKMVGTRKSQGHLSAAR